MPLHEGESLRQRLPGGQLRCERFAIAREVAERSTTRTAARRAPRHQAREHPAERGQAVVADFGIARAMTVRRGRLTRVRLAVGTPAYMAPSRPRATGRRRPRRPLRAGLRAVRDARRCSAVYRRDDRGCPGPSRRRPGAAAAPWADAENNSGGARVTRRCSEKICSRRYATAGELAAALDTATGPASASPPAHKLRRARRWFSRLQRGRGRPRGARRPRARARERHVRRLGERLIVAVLPDWVSASRRRVAGTAGRDRGPACHGAR